MPMVRLPVPLRPLAGGNASVSVAGSTAGQALESLLDSHPDLREKLLAGDAMASSTYESINLMLGYEDVQELDGWDTPVGDSDVLRIVRTWPAAISGGKQWNQPVGAEPPD